MNSWILAGGLISFSWGAGCTGDDAGIGDDQGDGECVPGMSEACACEDGEMGAQTCEPDGFGYGECVCGGSESGEGDGDDGDGDGDDGDGDGETGDGDTSGDGDGDGDGDTGGDGDGDGWDGRSTPLWSQHIVPFFYTSCGAGVNGCHSREAYAANLDEGCRGWLSLEDEALGSEIYAPPEDAGTPTGCGDMMLHDRLLTLAPWQCEASSAYVDTQDVQASYVLRKMRGVGLCEGENEQMPPPSSGIVITDQDIEMIEAWIEAGALMD